MAIDPRTFAAVAGTDAMRVSHLDEQLGRLHVASAQPVDLSGTP